MKALQSFEPLGTTFPVTQHHIPHNLKLQQHWSENLRPAITKQFVSASIQHLQHHRSGLIPVTGKIKISL
jgi:hypothetical protein